MFVRRLWLTDFRSYAGAEASFAEGLTAVLGPNGHGKSNLLEALGYLATLASFRGAPTDALIRAGTARAVVRGEAERDGRALLLEAELVAGGRNLGAQLNRQPLRRARDLLGALRVTVFSPDDLVLVKAGPAQRRRYLDEALVAVHPRHDALQSDVDRIIRQRNALLRQAGGRLSTEVVLTLDVFDAKLAAAGDALGAARRALLAELAPLLAAAYDHLARRAAAVQAVYTAPWSERGLAETLARCRSEDVRRGVSLVGPHRDDVELSIGGLAARTHASQGEQRSLALAMRFAAHEVVTTRTGSPPVLLLDDVFSELDQDRADSLLGSLPAGQKILTTAGPVPRGARPDHVLQVRNSTVSVG